MNSTRFLVLFGVSITFAVPAKAAEFELKDGDKVVWLGSTLIEREQRYGYWETYLTARWPDRKIRFRNLGWSGDNVFGEARLSFDINNPSIGLKRMVDLTLAEKPTVIFICYGTNESFEGEAGLEKFEKGYEKLLDELKPAKARIVLMTPIPFIPSGRSLPDPKEANRRLGLYVDAIKKIAGKRGLACADYFGALTKPDSSEFLRDCSDNGIHLNENGYLNTKDLLCNLLDAGGKRPEAIDSKKVDQLRQAIVEKNRLYFYRWRPQNETYLFGSRKHEQGKNAKEVAAFDPLIAKAEEKIDELQNPDAHRNEQLPAPVEK